MSFTPDLCVCLPGMLADGFGRSLIQATDPQRGEVGTTRPYGRYPWEAWDWRTCRSLLGSKMLAQGTGHIDADNAAPLVRLSVLLRLEEGWEGLFAAGSTLWDWIAWPSSDSVGRETCVHDMLVLMKEGDFDRGGTNTGLLGQVCEGDKRPSEPRLGQPPHEDSVILGGLRRARPTHAV